MKKLRERLDNVQQEQQEIEKAFDVIKEITDGQFGHGEIDDEYCKYMLEQYNSVKPVLFYTRNNKWLIMEYLAKHEEYFSSDKPYSLGQLISTLSGIQGQFAYENDDNELIDTLHIESCIWSSINMHAKYRLSSNA